MATVTDMIVVIDNKLKTFVYSFISCYQPGDTSYKTVQRQYGSPPLLPGKQSTYQTGSIPVCQENTLLCVMLFDSKTGDTDPPTAYILYDASTGKVVDKKTPASLPFRYELTGNTITITPGVLPPPFDPKKYWWVWLIVAAVLVAIIVTAVMLGRRKRMK